MTKKIRAALRNLYRRFIALLSELLADHRLTIGTSQGTERTASNDLDVAFSAWAIIGIGTIVDIQRELGLLSKTDRETFMRRAAGLILGEPNSN